MIAIACNWVYHITAVISAISKSQLNVYFNRISTMSQLSTVYLSCIRVVSQLYLNCIQLVVFQLHLNSQLKCLYLQLKYSWESQLYFSCRYLSFISGVSQPHFLSCLSTISELLYLCFIIIQQLFGTHSGFLGNTSVVNNCHIIVLQHGAKLTCFSVYLYKQ